MSTECQRLLVAIFLVSILGIHGSSHRSHSVYNGPSRREGQEAEAAPNHVTTDPLATLIRVTRRPGGDAEARAFLKAVQSAVKDDSHLDPVDALQSVTALMLDELKSTINPVDGEIAQTTDDPRLAAPSDQSLRGSANVDIQSSRTYDTAGGCSVTATYGDLQRVWWTRHGRNLRYLSRESTARTAHPILSFPHIQGLMNTEFALTVTPERLVKLKEIFLDPRSNVLSVWLELRVAGHWLPLTGSTNRKRLYTTKDSRVTLEQSHLVSGVRIYPVHTSGPLRYYAPSLLECHMRPGSHIDIY